MTKFQKFTRKCKQKIKGFLCSERAMTLAFMLIAFTGAVFAQNAAGNYEAGTSALTTVSEEIAKYVPIVVKLCYAIAGVVAIVGAISVYIAMSVPVREYVKCSFGKEIGKGSICLLSTT